VHVNQRKLLSRTYSIQRRFVCYANALLNHSDTLSLLPLISPRSVSPSRPMRAALSGKSIVSQQSPLMLPMSSPIPYLMSLIASSRTTQGTRWRQQAKVSTRPASVEASATWSSPKVLSEKSVYQCDEDAQTRTRNQFSRFWGEIRLQGAKVFVFIKYLKQFFLGTTQFGGPLPQCPTWLRSCANRATELIKSDHSQAISIEVLCYW